MVELKTALFFGGRVIPAGAKIGFLTKAQERALVEAGNAIYIRPTEVTPPTSEEEALPKAAEVMQPASADETPPEVARVTPPASGASQKLGRDGRGGR